MQVVCGIVLPSSEEALGVNNEEGTAVGFGGDTALRKWGFGAEVNLSLAGFVLHTREPGPPGGVLLTVASFVSISGKIKSLEKQEIL